MELLISLGTMLATVFVLCVVIAGVYGILTDGGYRPPVTIVEKAELPAPPSTASVDELAVPEMSWRGGRCNMTILRPPGSRRLPPTEDVLEWLAPLRGRGWSVRYFPDSNVELYLVRKVNDFRVGGVTITGDLWSYDIDCRDEQVTIWLPPTAGRRHLPVITEQVEWLMGSGWEFQRFEGILARRAVFTRDADVLAELAMPAEARRERNAKRMDALRLRLAERRGEVEWAIQTLGRPDEVGHLEELLASTDPATDEVVRAEQLARALTL